MLGSFFKGHHFNFTVTSEVLPGVERSFDDFWDAAEEAALSRLFAGQHFLFDLTTGERLCREVADFVVDRLLIRRHGEEESNKDQ